ncbi:MAG: SCO family protein [Bdellovibrionota bacterium]
MKQVYRQIFLKELVVLTAGLLLTFGANAYEPTGETPPLVAAETPEEIKDVGITQKTGAQLDMNLEFIDETGKTVKLGDYYKGGLPVIVSPVYFSCPGLCNFHLNGLTDGLKDLDWNAGEKFQVLAISFEPKDTPQTAAGKKDNYLKVYNRPGTEDGWHFLTASAGTVKTFTESVGFKFKWNEEANDWSHASAAIVTSPTGSISRYLPGVVFEAKDLKLALNEATQGKIGTFVESLVLYCFRYNPHQSRYVLYAFNVMKLAGLIMIVVLAIWLIPVWRRNRRVNEA